MKQNLVELANNDDVSAMYTLANAYEEGRGFVKSIKNARHWYYMAAKKGHGNAKIKLFRILNEQFLDKSPECQYRLAQACLTGDVVYRSEGNARTWMRIAEQNGFTGHLLKDARRTASGTDTPGKSHASAKPEKEPITVKPAVERKTEGKPIEKVQSPVKKPVIDKMKTVSQTDQKTKRPSKAVDGRTASSKNQSKSTASSRKTDYDKRNRQRSGRSPNSRFNPKDPVSQFNLAQSYLKGDHVKRSTELAIRWFKTAAENGNVDSMMELGSMYSDRKYIGQSYPESVKWYKMAYKHGCKDAEEKLHKTMDGLFDDLTNEQRMQVASDYISGKNLIGSGSEGKNWLEKTAREGSAEAALALVDYYTDKEASPSDRRHWLAYAANLGNCDAKFELTRTSDKNSGHISSESIAVYMEAADRGNSDAQLALGECYETGQQIDASPEYAADYYRRSMNSGNAEAAFRLGNLYETGRGVERSYDDAFEYYKIAVKNGFEQALERLDAVCDIIFPSKSAEQQYSIARMYEKGNMFEQSDTKAFHCYLVSAEAGFSDSQYKIGMLFESGTGTEQSYEQAFRWYHSSAEQDNKHAALKLSKFYRLGLGTEKSVTDSDKWLDTAIALKNARAEKVKKIIKKTDDDSADFEKIYEIDTPSFKNDARTKISKDCVAGFDR